MSGKHGEPLRGLMATNRSQIFEGRFGRLFRSLTPATFGADEDANHKHLGELGAKMSNSFDAPKDGQDDEESGIPALYTYFGQFIDHDITFDPSSSLQKQDDPDALTDYRSPAFDMDNVYGRGPDDQPYMYEGKSFLLGSPLHGGNGGARDLARNGANPSRALIGDPRNDENSLVSQLQGLVLRFHNQMVHDHPHSDFAHIQRLVRFHYQYVVLNDFLPRIVTASVLNDLKTAKKYDRKKIEFFRWKNNPFMPVEFSVAAYRLGHSMIRPGYRLNDDDKTLLPIFPVPSHHLNEGLTGFRAMNPHWGIDWGRFIDIDVRGYDGPDAIKKRRLQFAYRIDTSIVNPLSHLPPSVVDPKDPPDSLAKRNLLRSWRLGLPSGQNVARAMGVQPLADKDILIGQGVDKPDAPLKSVVDVNTVFANNCPLWTYILAEAMHHQETVTIPVMEKKTITTPQLGPVGGRIVAEVFLGLQFGDNHSLLNLEPDWQPETNPPSNEKKNPDYKLKDFVKYALGQ